jgi:hypothetical protein
MPCLSMPAGTACSVLPSCWAPLSRRIDVC